MRASERAGPVRAALVLTVHAGRVAGWGLGDDDGSLTLIRPGDNGNYLRKTTAMPE